MNHYQKRFRSLFIACIVIALSFFFLFDLSKAWAVSYPFTDNVENLESNYWVADSPWARVTSSSHSPNYAWTDSPASNYGNNVDLSLTFSTSINLTSGANPQLAYWCKYHLEDDYDVVRLEISLNGGAVWEAVPLA